jgi:hypothetical protein
MGSVPADSGLSSQFADGIRILGLTASGMESSSLCGGAGELLGPGERGAGVSGGTGELLEPAGRGGGLAGGTGGSGTSDTARWRKQMHIVGTRARCRDGLRGDIDRNVGG